MDGQCLIFPFCTETNFCAKHAKHVMFNILNDSNVCARENGAEKEAREKQKPETRAQCQLKEKEQFVLLLHKIPVNSDADFNAIFIYIKVRVYQMQNNSAWPHLALKLINAFRQAINTAITLMFAHSQIFSNSRESMFIFGFSFSIHGKICLVIFKYLTFEHL